MASTSTPPGAASPPLQGEAAAQTKPFVSALTTFPHRPLPSLSWRAAIHTSRLLLRPLCIDDLAAFHRLRSQPSFMVESSLGRADGDISETQAALDKQLASWETQFLFGIFLRLPATDGDGDRYAKEEVGGETVMIGDCGVHSLRGSCSGWPEIGYSLEESHRGKGYATEAVAAVLAAWWALPRGAPTVTVSVHPDTASPVVVADDGFAGRDGKEKETETGDSKKENKEESLCVTERVAAQIATYNNGSRRVLEKVGFRHFGTWIEPDTQLHRLGQPLEMGHYVLDETSFMLARAKR